MGAGVRRRAVWGAMLVAVVGCAKPAALPLAVGTPVGGKLTAGARTANVVVVVLDAARVDHVGCYGYPRHTTPSTDALAKEAVVFRNHFAPFAATQESTISLFTGLYPDTHRFTELQRVAPTTFTLEKALQGAGFRTALFTSNPNCSPGVAIGEDFEEGFGNTSITEIVHAEGEEWMRPEWLAQAFGEWLSAVQGKRFFAYCHLLPPHIPYVAPSKMREQIAAEPRPPVQQGQYEFPQTQPELGNQRPYPANMWEDLYDANLRWADWGVGEIARVLAKAGVLDNTLLIVTADHGEGFGEHGYAFHGRSVYDEVVHIPLVIRFPGPQRLVGEVTPLTQTVDLLPTILGLSGVSYPAAVQGKSLLPLLTGERSGVREYAFARADGDWPNYLMRNAAWSLILYRGGRLRALYDLKRDPAQRKNVIAEHKEEARKLVGVFEVFARTQVAALTAFVSPQAAGTAPPGKTRGRQLSDETRRQLRALGYVR